MVLNTRSFDTLPRDTHLFPLNLPSPSLSGIEPRRTRKRITPGQLVHLEELYRRSSHPTREQRDALGRRIQMETKSVTIWFQNKRQTDRKVALHKAAHVGDQANSHAENGKSKDEWVSKISENHANILKRTFSYSSSVSSTSSTSSKSKRPSLDRVASRSEIRFTDKNVFTKNDKISERRSPTAKTTPTSSSHHASLSISPISPTQNPGALWSHMLSSPVAPSSPPPVELVAYSRTRKTRTLDWACTVARLSVKEDDSPEGNAKCTLKPPFDISKQGVAMTEREYEDAIAITEDEDELVTPQASQASWTHKDQCLVTVTRCAKEEVTETASVHKQAHHLTKCSSKTNPWQEDEMHAALALCGLRG